MNTLVKNKIFLGSVIAVIIFGAVCVAVGVWMGSLPVGPLEIRELEITQMSFDVDNNKTTLILSNFGTSVLTVTAIEVNGYSISSSVPALPVSYMAGQNGATLEITYSAVTGIVTGNKYSVELFENGRRVIGVYTDTV